MDAQRKRIRAKNGENTKATIIAKTKPSSNIPLHIIHDVLLRLPMKSLLRFKAVCKPWCFLISDPKFKKLYLANKGHNVSYIRLSADDGGAYFHIHKSWPVVSFISIVNNNKVSEIKKVETPYPLKHPRRDNVVLGSCNGLLLISTYKETFLWNPSTGKRRKTSPISNIWEKYHNPTYVSGLGYDSTHDEYKAVLFFMDQGNSHMFIFRSRTGCWKEVYEDHDLPTEIYYDISNLVGRTANGAPHWHTTSYVDELKSIIYFDNMEEKFKKLETPPMPWWNDEFSVYEMVVLEGCLYIIHRTNDVGCKDFEFWGMKEYGVTESWTKLFVIRHRALNLMPLGFTNNGEEVVLHINSESLVTYNLKTEKEFFLFSTKNKFNVAASYVESFVSPWCDWEKKEEHGERKRKRKVKKILEKNVLSS